MGKIQYSLRENPFSKGDDDKYIASMRRREVLDQEDLIEAMVWKNTTLTRQDILGVLDLMKETVQEKLMEGHRVYTDFFKAAVSIKGSFRSEKDRFDDRRHRVEVSLNPASEFCKSFSRSWVKVERIHPRDRHSFVNYCYDYATRTRDRTLTAGGLVELKGDFFIARKAVTRVVLCRGDSLKGLPPLQIHEITKNKILLSLPAGLEEGVYHIDIIVDKETDEGRIRLFSSKTVEVAAPGNEPGDAGQMLNSIKSAPEFRETSP